MKRRNCCPSHPGAVYGLSCGTPAVPEFAAHVRAPASVASAAGNAQHVSGNGARVRVTNPALS